MLLAEHHQACSDNNIPVFLLETSWSEHFVALQVWEDILFARGFVQLGSMSLIQVMLGIYHNSFTSTYTIPVIYYNSLFINVCTIKLHKNSTSLMHSTSTCNVPLFADLQWYFSFIRIVIVPFGFRSMGCPHLGLVKSNFWMDDNMLLHRKNNEHI
jgi:hypothetical protein